MSPESQIDDIETKLNALSESYRAQGQSARNLIDIDQSSILDCLKNGVQSVQTVLASLEDVQDINISIEDSLSISLDYVTINVPKVPGAFVTEISSPDPRNTVVLGERCTQISTCFTKLSDSADKQLEDIMEIQLAATDIEAELDRLKAGLDETTEIAQTAVTTTRESLERKKTEKVQAQSRLTTVEAELRAVENKASENKTHRKIAKFLKYGALAATPVLGPIPAIGVAAVGQIGHMVLKDKKEDLISDKESFNAQNRAIQTEIASFEQQSRDLSSSLLTKKEMSSRCAKMSKQVQQAKRELICRANEYQTLKEAAGDFVLWTGELRNRAELMESFDEKEEISRGVRRLVGTLEGCERKDVRAICAPLKVLLDGGQEKRRMLLESLLDG